MAVNPLHAVQGRCNDGRILMARRARDRAAGGRGASSFSPRCHCGSALRLRAARLRSTGTGGDQEAQAWVRGPRHEAQPAVILEAATPDERSIAFHRRLERENFEFYVLCPVKRDVNAGARRSTSTRLCETIVALQEVPINRGKGASRRTYPAHSGASRRSKAWRPHRSPKPHLHRFHCNWQRTWSARRRMSVVVCVRRTKGRSGWPTSFHTPTRQSIRFPMIGTQNARVS
ncbi:hypothetical protein OH76DRAFT_811252 [Lentinus brumalis]|uniref:Uncharacterized protein n=1 Tax=Lentinus brumalis TaxID=2498619 RepID=A0A371D342_9APHY|nr:hypothetical protein OH76DRAFT_811252 [Polyporus brumalis]